MKYIVFNALLIGLLSTTQTANAAELLTPNGHAFVSIKKTDTPSPSPGDIIQTVVNAAKEEALHSMYVEYPRGFAQISDWYLNVRYKPFNSFEATADVTASFVKRDEFYEDWFVTVKTEGKQGDVSDKGKEAAFTAASEKALFYCNNSMQPEPLSVEYTQSLSQSTPTITATARFKCIH